MLGPDTLTVNERVLLHLRESARDAADPYPLTQPGIAETLGIRVNHVSRAVKQLIRQRLVSEGVSRIRGEVRKRKVYGVTPDGHALAQKLVQEVSQRRVVAVDASGEREVAAGEARRFVAPPTLTRLFSAVDSDGKLDLRKPAAAPAREHAHREEGRPPPKVLVGREKEADAFRSWLADGPPVLAILGPRGIGKTALASACLDDERPRFWWSVRETDTPYAFLEGLAAWLADLGKGDLRTKIAKEPPDWREVARVLARDLRSSGAILVLDEAHAANGNLAPYLDAVTEAVVASGARLAVTSEEALPQRAALLADRMLREIRLGGLDRAAAKAILAGAEASEFEKAYRLTKGNPLSLKLMAAEETPGEFTPEERALLKVLKMRQDEG